MMLHLAQIQQNSISEPSELRLLAAQGSEDAWTVLTGEVLLPPDQSGQFKHAQLVLADISEDQQVVAVQDAQEWVVDLVQRYLGNGITPAFLEKETERAEQWRQSLTLQSQELDRRALEMEARREQIQELEESLKRERHELELERASLQALKDNLG
jgi:small-conductance mechanosensitive channel